MTVLWVCLLSIVSTAAGGLCALALRTWLDRVLGFTAGAVLGLVAFDVLPEVFELARQSGGDGRLAWAALVCGLVAMHGARRPGTHRHAHAAVAGRAMQGTLYAAAMIGHSFVDGLGIGLAFQVSDAAGLAVAAAVLAHDFCDGVDTVGLVLLDRGSTSFARRLLALDALAPAAGAALSVAVQVPPRALDLGLGFFGGTLLYIGTLGVLPRVLARAHTRGVTPALVLPSLGAGLVGVIRLAAW
jgi:zinc transporter ZupT